MTSSFVLYFLHVHVLKHFGISSKYENAGVSSLASGKHR